ncbi:hypothetical protein Tco_0422262 [Tanacetum coccineum]
MHKEAQQAAGGPTSLGATSEEGAHPQLSSGMSAFTLIKPVYSVSFIFTLSLHQEDMDEGTQNYSLDHKLTGTNPSVLVDKTKSAGDGLKTAHTDSGLPLWWKMHQGADKQECFPQQANNASPAEGKEHQSKLQGIVYL